MTRQELYARRQRKKKAAQKKKMIMAGLTAILLLAVVLVVRAGIAAGKKDADKKNVQTAETLDDKTGENGDTALLEALSSDTGNIGWNIDDTGWWYKTEDNKRYVNGWKTLDGDKYYFGEDGYLLKGWHTLKDGTYACFSESGIYMPDAPVKYVALTFDDGPSRDTDEILDVLEAYNAKATFFVVCYESSRDQESEDNMIRAYNEGMEIGSHTWDHTILRGKDAATIQSVMKQNDDYLQKLLGFTPTLMRPTGGGIDDTVAANVGKPMILWDVDTLDWDTKDPDNTCKVIREEVKDGSIVLMHDIYETTAQAVAMIVPELSRNGYRMVTVSELAKIKGVTLESGQQYGSFIS